MTTWLTIPTPAVTAAAADQPRHVAGLLVPWDTPGHTSLGSVRIRRGALRLPADLTHLPLLFGHDRDQPIGVAAAVTDTDDGLRGLFHIARTPLGQRYLAELDPDTPIRSGWSVELDNVVLDGDTVTAADLIAVAAVPLPAYSQSRAALAASRTGDTTMTDTPAPAELTAADAAPQTVAAAPCPTLVAAATPVQSLNAAPPRPVHTSPVSAFRLLCERMTEARLTGQVGPMLSAALADVTPTGNGVGNEGAGLMAQALGELWSGVAYQPVYRPFVVGGPLTGTKVSGFRWNPAPTVADYAGDKAAIPSNAAKLDFAEVAPTRLAGGHDIDRIYNDLGDAAVMASYWRLMAESVAVQLDARARAAIVAAGSALITGETDVAVARLKGTIAVQQGGGAADYCLIATDLALTLASTPASQAPVDVPFNVPPYTIAADLAAGTLIVGDSRAVRQLTFEPPIRAEAVNIPNGGIDAALFSYSAELVENHGAVVGYTVVPAIAAAAAAPAKARG